MAVSLLLLSGGRGFQPEGLKVSIPTSLFLFVLPHHLGSRRCFFLWSRDCSGNIYTLEPATFQDRWERPFDCEQPAGLHHSGRKRTIVLVLQ